MNVTQRDRAKIRLLHRQGYCDREIGQQIGCSRSVVAERRQAMKLPTLPQKCRERVARWHGEGLLDKEIAAKLNVGRTNITAVQVSTIRRSLGLKAHKRSMPGSHREKVHSFAAYRCRPLMSESQITRLYNGLGYG